MKPDMKLFKDLDDDAQFHQWKDHFIGTYIGTSLDECCDFDYVPSPAEEKSFHNKDKWMYTILMNIVKTPDELDIIRKHRETNSRRQLLQELILQNSK